MSRNRFCDFLADPDSRSFSRFGAIIMQFAVLGRFLELAFCSDRRGNWRGYPLNHVVFVTVILM